MKEKKWVKNLIKAILFLAVTVLILLGLTKLLQPKFYYNAKSNSPETEMWKEFYSLPKNSLDLLCLGTSSAYCGIESEEITRLTGLNTYTMSCSSARVSDLYYLLRETLRFQSPKYVVMEMVSLRIETYSSKTLYKRAYDGMKWSSVKLEALKVRNARLQNPEPMIYRVFTLLDYHTRWNELSEVDFFPNRYRTIQMGFVPSETVSDSTTHSHYHEQSVFEIDEDTADYFKRIVDLCDEKGIQLALVSVPVSTWNESYHEAVSKLANEYDLTYIDYNDDVNFPRIGIVDTQDWRDDAHLNLYGARKLAPVLSEDILSIYR